MCATPTLTGVRSNYADEEKNSKRTAPVSSRNAFGSFNTETSSLNTTREYKKDNNVKTNNSERLIVKRPAPPIKQTIAQVLREGARIQKTSEEEEKKLSELCNGSTDAYRVKFLKESLKEEQKEAELREIERKHLLGLISQAQAKLSKMMVQKNKQAQANELKLQAQKLEREMLEFRRQEEFRLRELYERTHTIDALARIAQENLINEKKKTAQQIQEESRKLKILMQQQRQQELDEKMKLIKHIKQLEQAAKSSMGKESTGKDGSTTSLSSMTFDQLKSALAKLKKQIEMELEVKREKIQVEKQRQKEIIEKTKEQIERHRNIPKPPKKKATTLQPSVTPELLELRQKLDRKKQEAKMLYKKV